MSNNRTVMFAVTHTDGGGTQQVWNDLGKAFADRGHAVTMLALYRHWRGDLPLADGLHWRSCLDQPAAGADWFGVAYSAMSLVAEISPDVIFTALPMANILLPCINKIVKPSTSVFISHHVPVGTYNPRLNKLDSLVGTLPLVKASICVSEAVRASLAGKPAAYRRKAVVIRNALPPAIEKMIERLRGRGSAEATNEPQHIIACGRLHDQKNLAVLIRAMAHVNQECVLEIVGEGPDEANLKRMAAECCVTRTVRFLGARSREDSLALIAGSSVFVQPSRFEGHSLALVEAAKFGLPMIVSDVPAQVEAVTNEDRQHCAVLVGPDDHIGWAEAISRMIVSPEQRRMYATLSQSLANGLRFSDMVSRYDDLIMARYNRPHVAAATPIGLHPDLRFLRFPSWKVKD